MINLMDIKVFRLSFPEIELSQRDAHKLRGFIASLFPQHNEFHNHDEKGWLYRYPLIQYKVLKGIPYVIGINQGAEKLLQVEDDLQKLVLEGCEIPVYEKSLIISNETIGVLDDVIQYSFVTPWMALNQDNYSQYQISSGVVQREKLKSILIGNILSLSKGLDYRVESKIVVDLANLRPTETKFKDQKMITFKGNFFVNFAIPDYLGLGKSVSRGFGTVCRCK